jgi:hypothetical protein
LLGRDDRQEGLDVVRAHAGEFASRPGPKVDPGASPRRRRRGDAPATRDRASASIVCTAATS